MWRYQKYLTPLDQKHLISLGEGNTPLIRSKKIGPDLGLEHLYFKLENLNPSGSYKDRFASAFISTMKSRGQGLCIATSSGNTGAALSAYSAAAGVKCILVIVDGAPVPKIKQMQLYGSTTVMVNGFGKDTEVTQKVFEELDQMTRKIGVPLPVSAYCYCPEGMQGVQTIVYELMESMPVDHIFSPAGGGGLCLSMARGVISWALEHPSEHKARVHCVQPEGNDTISSALRSGADFATVIPGSTTQISGLQVPNILDANPVIRECRALGGNGYLVNDLEVFSYQKKLAQQEGIFSEPAGAVALAGLVKAVEMKEIKKHEKIVCLITGSGFKDLQSVENNFGLPPIEKVDLSDLQSLLNQSR